MQKHFKYRIRMQEGTENPGVWQKEKRTKARKGKAKSESQRSRLEARP